MEFKPNKKLLIKVYLGFLLIASVIPIGNVASDILMDNYTLEIRWDYLLHALIYLPLPLGLRYGFKWKNGGGFLVLIFISVLIPVLFELFQMWIPYRSFNVNDLLANCFGVLLGWVIVLFWRKRSLSPQN